MLSTIADILGVVGFALTCFTAFKVFFLNRDIKVLSNKYLFSQRIDEHLDDFKKSADQVFPLLTNPSKNIQLIRIIVVECLASCKSLEKKILRSEVRSLVPLLDLSEQIVHRRFSNRKQTQFFKILAIKPTTDDDIEEYYLCLIRLINDIENLNKDRQKTLT